MVKSKSSGVPNGWIYGRIETVFWWTRLVNMIHFQKKWALNSATLGKGRVLAKPKLDLYWKWEAIDHLMEGIHSLLTTKWGLVFKDASVFVPTFELYGFLDISYSWFKKRGKNERSLKPIEKPGNWVNPPHIALMACFSKRELSPTCRAVMDDLTPGTLKIGVVPGWYHSWWMVGMVGVLSGSGLLCVCAVWLLYSGKYLVILPNA